MTIANAMKEFFYKLNGVRPSGNNIADVIRNGANSVQLDTVKESVVLKSSTADSEKTFAITVNDSGNIAATELDENGDPVSP